MFQMTVKPYLPVAYLRCQVSFFPAPLLPLQDTHPSDDGNRNTDASFVQIASAMKLKPAQLRVFAGGAELLIKNDYKALARAIPSGSFGLYAHEAWGTIIHLRRKSTY